MAKVRNVISTRCSDVFRWLLERARRIDINEKENEKKHTTHMCTHRKSLKKESSRAHRDHTPLTRTHNVHRLLEDAFELRFR